MRDADIPLPERITLAIERISKGQAPMRVPVEATDPDMVLADCAKRIAELEAERDAFYMDYRLKCDVETKALTVERDALRALLAIEQQLAVRGNPFRCQDIECSRYGQKLFAGDCLCYDMQAREHRAKVTRALAAKGEEGE